MERVKAFFGRMFSGNDEDNRHKFIFLTKEEQEIPSTIKLPEPEKPPGLILEDGSINWNCPCLGGMVAGPCGVQFRTAFSCFHYSEAEPKGSDCMEAFNKMHECMQKYPALYGPDDKDDDEDIFGLEQTENDAEMSKGDREPKPVVNRSERNSKSVVDGGDLDPKSVIDKGNRDPQSVAQINNEDPPKNESQDQEVEIKSSSS